MPNTPNGTTFLAGKPPPGQTYDGSASRVQISADGLWVVYHHGSENLVAVQQAAGELPQAARTGHPDLPDEPRHRGDGAGEPWPTNGCYANGESSFPDVSADGRYVVFTSQGTNLVPATATASSRTSSSRT